VNKTIKLAGLLIGAALAPAAHAEFYLRADVGAGRTDNVSRVSVDPIAETIGLASLGLSWSERSRRLEADVNIDGDYLHYRNGTYSDEFVGYGDGQLTFGIVPERFTWLVQDTFGQAQADPFAVATPDSRQDVNYFTTGPDIILNLGQANSMRLFGRYSLVDFEVSDFDSERITGGLSLGRRFSSASSIAVVGTFDEVRFDNLPASDYDARNVFLRFASEYARSSVALEAGYSWIERLTGSKISGPLFRADVSRSLSTSSQLTVSFGTQFSDATQALRNAVDSAPSSGDLGVAASPDPFENRFAEAGWTFDRNRTGLEAFVSWSEDRYQQQTAVQPQSDRSRWIYGAGVTRRVTSNFTAALRATLSDEEYGDAGETSEALTVAAEFDWQMGRRVGLSVRAEYYDRSSSDATTEFDELRGFVTLFYRYGGADTR
jgi:hypothetical protein